MFKVRKNKLIRIATVPSSLNILLKGQLEFLSHDFETIGVSSHGDDLTETQLREGIKVVPVNMERGISPVKDLISLFKLYLLFKREKPQIVHSITPKAGLLSMLAGKFASVPIRMHTFTGLVFPTKNGIMKNILILMDRLLCWAATNVYPEGNGVKNDLIAYRITGKPLHVLANGNVNGINLDHYSNIGCEQLNIYDLKDKLGIGRRDFVFVFVGRLVGDKGVNELISAFKSLNNVSCKLLLVGSFEDHLDPLLGNTMVEIANNPNIVSVGFQKDVRPYLTISDALILPSYREGFPNVVLQAGAMQLPCIVTDINGSNEIIKNDVNGIVIPKKDSVSILKAMRKMMQDGNYYNFLRDNSRSMIESRYDQSLVWEALKEEYDRLLKGIEIK